MANTYPCKGASTVKCTCQVTYDRKPVLSVTEVKLPKGKISENAAVVKKRATMRVYLTCALNHTNPYDIDAGGNIVG
jgi:hypothetical protein